MFSSKQFQNVSESCLDFMKQLLSKDPNNRLSAADALKHPFITGIILTLFKWIV